jgi:hypothetical protein
MTPPTPTESGPERYADGEATMLAAGLGGSVAERVRPEAASPTPPLSAAEFGAGTHESYSDAGATMLASGFGTDEPSHEAFPPNASEPGKEFSEGGATMFSSGFDTGHEREPAPSYASPADASNEADSYPPGEATMLAQSLMGEPSRPDHQPARGFEPIPEGGFESAPEGGLASPAASGLGPETGLPEGDATRLASGGGLPWESAALPVESPHPRPSADAGWTEAAPAPIPAAEVQPVRPVEPQVPGSRKANWAVWAAVPLVAIVLGVGAWYFLTHTGGPETGAPSTTPSSAPGTTAAPPVGSGAAQQPATQQQPAAGSTAPAAGGPAENAGAGAGAKPEESKPAPEETKPAEKRPVDTRAVQALKAEGDLDYDKGQYDDAIRSYRKGLALDPGNRVLTQQINRAKKAKQTEEKLLQ